MKLRGERMTEKENQKEKDNTDFPLEDNIPSTARINYAGITLEEAEDLLKFGNEKVRQKILKYFQKHSRDIL